MNDLDANTYPFIEVEYETFDLVNYDPTLFISGRLCSKAVPIYTWKPIRTTATKTPFSRENPLLSLSWWAWRA